MVESFSGIRGIWKNDLSKNHVIKYARSFSAFLKEKYKKSSITIVIGRDSRQSGLEIMEIFQDTLMTLGVDIIDVGLNTTPIIENAVRNFDADGGIIITASHNPPEYNGWKLLERRGNVLYPNDANTVIKATKQDRLDTNSYKKGELFKKYDESISAYINLLEDTFKDRNIDMIDANLEVSVLVDPNGGSASNIVGSILDKYKIKNKVINNHIGKFERDIEPNQKSLAKLHEILLSDDYDFACGFDCDADRIELVSKKRGVISGQYVFGLITKYLLKLDQNHTKKIVANDATSYLVKDLLPNDFSWNEVEVGEANIVNEHDSDPMNIGGEGSSGGVIIPPSRCRDGIMTLLFVISLLKEQNISLDEAIDQLPSYTTLTTKIKTEQQWSDLRLVILNVAKKHNIVYRATGGNTGGVKLFFDKGWLWFRGSKTEENTIRIISDSQSKEVAEELINKGINIIGS